MTTGPPGMVLASLFENTTYHPPDNPCTHIHSHAAYLPRGCPDVWYKSFAMGPVCACSYVRMHTQMKGRICTYASANDGGVCPMMQQPLSYPMPPFITHTSCLCAYSYANEGAYPRWYRNHYPIRCPYLLRTSSFHVFIIVRFRGCYFMVFTLFSGV